MSLSLCAAITATGAILRPLAGRVEGGEVRARPHPGGVERRDAGGGGGGVLRETVREDRRR